VAAPTTRTESTADRLVSAAERLFAERGIEAVTVRDITKAASANTAAMHYHFGSKEVLLRAVLERRAAELRDRRDALLREVESSAEPTLRLVVESLVVPTAELAADDRHGGRYYVGFLASLLDHPGYLSLIDELFDEQMRRYLAAIARVTPHLSPEVRELRFGLAKDVVNRALALPGRGVRLWVEAKLAPTVPDLTNHVVDFLVGAFAAPSH
jgi:AcrR family transcriptional regulator